MNRHRVWELVEIAKSGDAMSHAVDIALMALIILNVIGVVIGSMPSVDAAYGDMLWLFEVFSVAVFTVEYGIRIWVCKEDMRYAGPAGRARYVVSPMAIIDLLAILPFYLPFVGVDARIMRIFRLFRLVRILKLGRYSKAFGIIGRVFAAKKEELVLATITLFFLLLIAATLMFYAEQEAQPERFSSIPATLWWAVVTLTTVGYGDVFPVTTIGKVLGGIIATVGIGVVALPAGIISSGFIEEIDRRRRAAQPRVCPHCGKPLHD